MKKIIVIFAIALTSSIAFADWTEFHLKPVDMKFNKKISLGNHLPSPSGAKGFISVDGTQFVYNNEETAKFWGTNISYNGNFPDRDFAEVVARDLKRWGINIVRLHHMDAFYYGESSRRGIFKNNTYEELSPKGLDQMFYFLSRLKHWGIYYNINLFVSRKFKNESGTTMDISRSKSIGQFAPTLIQKQKDYARDLLTTVNPYTGFTLADDPSCVFVEIINEHSIWISFAGHALDVINPYSRYQWNRITAYGDYLDIIDAGWAEFLENKYGTVADLKTAWSLTSPSAPTTKDEHATAWTLNELNSAEADLNYSSGVAEIGVTTVGAVGDIEYSKNISVTENKLYDITFTVYSPTTVSMAVEFNSTRKTFESNSTADRVVSFIYKAESTESDVPFKILLGSKLETVQISSLTVKESDIPIPLYNEKDFTEFTFSRPYYTTYTTYPQNAIDDYVDYLAKIESDYYSEMRSYLVDELNVKAQITATLFTSLYKNDKAKEALINSDITVYDTHGYWQHPNIYGWPDTTYFKFENGSMIAEGLTYPVRLETDRVDAESPMLISEWGAPYPNEYGYEAGAVMGQYGKIYDYAGLFQFDYTSYKDISSSGNSVNNFFNIYQNAQQRIMMGIGSKIYFDDTVEETVSSDILELKGDTVFGASGFIAEEEYTHQGFTISTSAEASLYLAAVDENILSESKQILLVAINQIKNTGSSFTPEPGPTNPNWGSAPSLMKDLTTNVTLPALSGREYYQVNEINLDGTLGDVIELTGLSFETDKHFVLIQKRKDLYDYTITSSGSGGAKIQSSGTGKLKISFN